MYAYIQESVARKARDTGDDLISGLITDYVATGQLDYDTVAVHAVIMMQAGDETTANMIRFGNRCAARTSRYLRRLAELTIQP